MAARCLVVDDDEWTRDYMTSLLARLGIAAESAADGAEAVGRLKASAYDVMFLDLDMPALSGEGLLAGLATQRQRPAAIVVMSGAVERLEKIRRADWSRLGISAALPKPLGAADVRSAVARFLGGAPAPVAQGPGSVLIAGAGLWADALARVVVRGGGRLLVGRHREESLALIASERPAAVVAGPPISELDLQSFCAAAAEACAESLVVAAVSRADVNLRRALVAAGAAKVCVVPSAASDLAVAIVTAAHLNTRAHSRVPLVVHAIVETRGERYPGFTKDLSEGGLCLEHVPGRVARGRARVEFRLPDQQTPVVADTEVMWSGGEDLAFRAGVRFADMPETDRTRLRGFLARALSKRA